MTKSEKIEKALEHYELARTHLGVALHLLTELYEPGMEKSDDLIVLGKYCAYFLHGVQPIFKKLCDAGVYKMPPEALSVLANTDPRTYLEVAERVRKERAGAD